MLLNFDQYHRKYNAQSVKVHFTYSLNFDTIFLEKPFQHVRFNHDTSYTLRSKKEPFCGVLNSIRRIRKILNYHERIIYRIAFTK